MPRARRDRAFARDPETRLKLILHIGATKTGSSALQAKLDVNRRALVRAGVLYPAAGVAAGAHHLLAACLHPNAAGLHRDALPVSRPAREALFDALAEEILEEARRLGADRLILSSEYLWGVFPETVYRRWRAVFGTAEVILYAVLRRPGDWVQSSYLQAVKSGEAAAFDHWYLRFAAAPLRGADFAAVIAGWEDGIAPDRIVLDEYDRLRRSGALSSGLAALAGFRCGAVSAPARSPVNPSPGPLALKALLEVNRSDLPAEMRARARRRILSTMPQRRVGAPLDLIERPQQAALHEDFAGTLDRLRRAYGFSFGR